MKASRLDLADSSLHAPAAGFEGQDFYPDIVDKAAVLTCRLAWNHPLLDGNKRAAWASLVLFIDLNDGVWDQTLPTSTRLRPPCSPSPPTRSTRPGSPTGYGVGCSSGSRGRAGCQPTLRSARAPQFPSWLVATLRSEGAKPGQRVDRLGHVGREAAASIRAATSFGRET